MEELLGQVKASFFYTKASQQKEKSKEKQREAKRSKRSKEENRGQQLQSSLALLEHFPKAGLKRCLDLNELEEMRNDAYLNSKIAKERLKKWHDQLVNQKNFAKGQRVLLYDSKLHLFPGKLKSRWTGPFIIHDVQSNGVVELLNFNSTRTFKVNGHRLEPYIESFSETRRNSSSLIHLQHENTWFMVELSLFKD
ncbi:hypothetical protein AAG906_019984 [Vitis piasezkii]